MNGLHQYERDLALPVVLGDVGLCPPTPDEIQDIVESTLRADLGIHAAGASLCHARWKPHTSMCASYAVRFDDGSEHLVTWKRYAGDKASGLAKALGRRSSNYVTPLLPVIVLPDERVVISTFPHDRVLRGLETALDPKRICRRLASTAGFAGANLRHRRSRSVLMRYKPERRAVFCFAAAVRDEERSLTTTSVGVRVLPTAAAARLVRARAASGIDDLGWVPALQGDNQQAGLVFEQWLCVLPLAHDDFSRSTEIAALLAELHSLPCSNAPEKPREQDTRELLTLFEFDRSVWNRARSIIETPFQTGHRPCWTHGDLHPDQVAQDARTGELRILDWDCLAVRDPLFDVASFAADALAAGAFAAAAQFVDAYRAEGGAPFTEAALDVAVAQALCARAAACLRRLERGATAQAQRLLELAEARRANRWSLR